MHELTGLAVREVTEGATLATSAACAVMMRPNGRLVTAACSDPLVEKIDQTQYQLGNGPCLHALRDVEVVSVSDTAAEGRWPEFQARAAQAGIRSCLSVPFGTAAKAAVNFYSRTAGAFGEREMRRAAEFADEASGALAVAERLAALADTNVQLRASMATRTIIDTAIGIMIEREHRTREQAFDELKSASQNSNVKLRELAARIVSAVTGEPVQYSVRFDDPSAAGTVG
ncbi:MAG TPA: GAF and ANTAR domain-containing protein [Streptosporangiaceae bacterium]|nr:GAF and ANTAR domain-containing protein [Streptosporangiaceae bacterium]